MLRLIYFVLLCLMALNVEAQGLRLPTKRQHSKASSVRVTVKKPAPQRKVVVNRPRVVKPRSVQPRPSKPVSDYDVYVYDDCPTAKKKAKSKSRNSCEDSDCEDPEYDSSGDMSSEDADKIYTIAEQMPSFKGNVNSWLSSHIQYPAVAAENGVQGRVIVKFVVTAEGYVSQTQVVRGVDQSLDRDAIRVVNSMPAWNPGMNNGEYVNVWFTLPITFKLQ